MNKIISGLLVVMGLALAGCGGGGGTSTTPDSPLTDPTTRTITGKVVSTASGNPGVGGVTVSIGSYSTGIYSTSTNADGTFTIGPINSAAYIPPTFKVDTTGAGSAYRRDDLVTYNNQQYLYDAVDIPVAFRNGDTNNLGTITVVYDPEGAPTLPYPNKTTVITGRVVRSDDPTIGIAGVTVTFGNLSAATTFTTQTGTKGYFAIPIGNGVDVISLFSASNRTFAINTSTANPAYPPASYPYVLYNGTPLQSSIDVPDDVLTGQSNDLGNIQLLVGSNSGGDNPPPPPTN